MSPPAFTTVDTATAVGIDIGGTRLRVATITADGTVLERHVMDRPDAAADQGFGGAVVDAVTQICTSLGPDLPVGVGIASLVDRDGTLVQATNLEVDGFPLAARLQERLVRPVRVVNDATAACWAEARVGAAAGHDEVVLVTIGTGVGGGGIIGGVLLEGASGLAGEFGHVIVNDGGRRCPCGSYGCVEAYASGRAVGEIAAEWLASGRTSQVLATEPVIDGAAVHRAASAGDELAIEVVEEAGAWLGVALANLVNSLDPGMIVIGGGAGASLQHWLLPAARTAMATRVLGHQRRALPPVRVAALGDDAGMVGAALLAMEQPT